MGSGHNRHGTPKLKGRSPNLPKTQALPQIPGTNLGRPNSTAENNDMIRTLVLGISIGITAPIALAQTEPVVETNSGVLSRAPDERAASGDHAKGAPN